MSNRRFVTLFLFLLALVIQALGPLLLEATKHHQSQVPRTFSSARVVDRHFLDIVHGDGQTLQQQQQMAVNAGIHEQDAQRIRADLRLTVLPGAR